MTPRQICGLFLIVCGIILMVNMKKIIDSIPYETVEKECVDKNNNIMKNVVCEGKEYDSFAMGYATILLMLICSFGGLYVYITGYEDKNGRR